MNRGASLGMLPRRPEVPASEGISTPWSAEENVLGQGTDWGGSWGLCGHELAPRSSPLGLVVPSDEALEAGG